jgi:hypothetical protein
MKDVSLIQTGGAIVRRVFSRIVLAIAPVLLVMTLAAVRGKAQARPSMELLETKPSVTQSTLDIVGQVKNISPRELSGVTVVCDFLDASGKIIKGERGQLETDPLGPNKVSEFKISTAYSAGIKGFKVSFSQMFGGPLVTKDSRKP